MEKIRTTSEQTVGELAAATPAAARVFETLGIDYCCGGKLSLSAACARTDVPVESVLRLLEGCNDTSETTGAADVPPDAPLGDLTHHIIERHHGFVRREAPRIQSLLAKVCEKHGRIHGELNRVSSLFTTLERDLAAHMMKEENILFPYIEALGGSNNARACFASVETPIAVMIADHDYAGQILAQIRALTNGYRVPEKTCTTFRTLYQALQEFERDLHWHVHLENNILFPRAIAAEREQLGAAAPAK